MPVQSEIRERKGKLNPEGSISDSLLRRQEGLCGVYPSGDPCSYYSGTADLNGVLCRRCTRARSCRTRRASCCSGRPPRSSAGTSTTEALPSCGGEAVSSEAGRLLLFSAFHFSRNRFLGNIISQSKSHFRILGNMISRSISHIKFLGNIIPKSKSLARFLGNIKAAFDKNPSLDNLLLDDFFRDAIHNCQV